MGTPKRKVKKSATKRFSVQLEKTVTLRLTSVIEVEIAEPDRGKLFAALQEAIRQKLAVERCNDIEREWLTNKVDENSEFSFSPSSIAEITPHL